MKIVLDNDPKCKVFNPLTNLSKPTSWVMGRQISHKYISLILQESFFSSGYRSLYKNFSCGLPISYLISLKVLSFRLAVAKILRSVWEIILKYYLLTIGYPIQKPDGLYFLCLAEPHPRNHLLSIYLNSILKVFGKYLFFGYNTVFILKKPQYS